MLKDADIKLQQIEELWNDKACNDFPDLRNILKSVRDEMLVVRSAQLDTQNRASQSERRHSRSDSILPRRQSSGQVFRSLGDMKIVQGRDPELSRRNTLETPSVPHIRRSIMGPIVQDPSHMD